MTSRMMPPSYLEDPALRVQYEAFLRARGLDPAEVKYAPGQPRDDHGRWTRGGGVSIAAQQAGGARENLDTVLVDPASGPALIQAAFNLVHDDVHLDTNGMSRDTARATGYTVDRLLQEYPRVGGYLTEVKVEAPPDGDKQCVAFTRDDGSHCTINVNPLWANEPRLNDMLYANEQAGFHPKGASSTDSIVTHEFGHAVTFEVLANRSENGRTEREILRRVLYDYDSPDNRMALSGYAGKSNDVFEVIAESFTASYYSPPEVIRANPLTEHYKQFFTALAFHQREDVAARGTQGGTP